MQFGHLPVIEYISYLPPSTAYYLKDLIDKESEPHHVPIKLQAEPTFIAVNCDQEWLAVISTTMLFVYKILDFQNPVSSFNLRTLLM